MGKFWEGLAGQLGADWASRLLMPSFMFWATGVLAYMLGQGVDVARFGAAAAHIVKFKTVELGAVAVVAVVVLFLSGLVSMSL